MREEVEVAVEREGQTRARDDGEGARERERVGRHPAERIPLPLYFGRKAGGAGGTGRLAGKGTGQNSGGRAAVKTLRRVVGTTGCGCGRYNKSTTTSKRKI